MKFLKDLWYNLINFRKNKTFDQINAKLLRALEAKRRGQFNLTRDMKKYMRKYLKVGANSEFIPLDRRSNCEIIKIIEKKYGKRMEKFDVSLNSRTMEIVCR